MAKSILDLLPERIITDDPQALTMSEIAKQRGFALSHACRIVKDLKDRGEVERVFRRVGTRLVPVYRAVEKKRKR